MKMQSALWAGGVFLACSVSAQAANMAFMNHTILSSIPKSDIPGFRAVVTQVLDSKPDGSSTTWTGSKPRRGLPVSVQMTVDQTVETQKANQCRHLDAKFTQGARAEDWAFWFCKDAAGQWKASRN